MTSWIHHPPYSGVALLAGHSGRAPAPEHLSASQSSALQQVRALAALAVPMAVQRARLKLRDSTGNELVRGRGHVLRFCMQHDGCVLEILTLWPLWRARNIASSSFRKQRRLLLPPLFSRRLPRRRLLMVRVRGLLYF